MPAVHVQLSSASYEIEIGSGLLSRAGQLIRGWLPQLTRAVIITDEQVQGLYGPPLEQALRAEGLAIQLLSVPAGEPSKSVAAAQMLWNQLLAAQADRQTAIIALGGGVVGDLAGFVAATFLRGVPLIQVPTTLLAQVDSSVGGKVGVNLPGGKNLVGAFWQPRGVLIDTQVLHSLDQRNYQAGLAEVIKYGVILDADFFQRLEQSVEQLVRREPQLLGEVVACCCRLKADVVEADEREVTGQRAVLNYGHTFAHALEAAAGYGQLLHGEAVAIGMVCASRLAERLGRIDASVTERQRCLLAACGLPVTLPKLDPQPLIEIMRHDKKAEHGQLRFVLPSRLGHVELVDAVAIDQVAAVLTN